MKKIVKPVKAFTTILLILNVISMTGCFNNNGNIGQLTVDIDTHHDQFGSLPTKNPSLAKDLKMLDTLDYEVFSNQGWVQLHESHAQDIKVYWPDGHVTTGIEKHIEDLKSMFSYAPDIRIKQFPINIGSGNMTVVTGIFEGTFTKPMPIGNGKFIQPTGKAFKIPICTIAIWNPDGIMSEEHLFWDNYSYANEIRRVK